MNSDTIKVSDMTKEIVKMKSTFQISSKFYGEMVQRYAKCGNEYLAKELERLSQSKSAIDGFICEIIKKEINSRG